MKNTKSGIITQSNYIPWKGFFDSIRKVDVFVVYDEMQYTRRDWRNRNKIKTPKGLKWLTIPVNVKGKYKQKINETTVADKTWNLKHLEIIKQNYKHAAAYSEKKDWLEELYMTCNYDLLTEVNLHFIRGICKLLEIQTEIRLSSEFNLAEDRNQRLLDICNELKITDYYSGPAAKAYMDEDLFLKQGMNVHFWDYSGYPTYNQLYGDFEHGVSILDLILNEGSKAYNYLK